MYKNDFSIAIAAVSSSNGKLIDVEYYSAIPFKPRQNDSSGRNLVFSMILTYPEINNLFTSYAKRNNSPPSIFL